MISTRVLKMEIVYNPPAPQPGQSRNYFIETHTDSPCQPDGGLFNQKFSVRQKRCRCPGIIGQSLRGVAPQQKCPLAFRECATRVAIHGPDPQMQASQHACIVCIPPAQRGASVGNFALYVHHVFMVASPRLCKNSFHDLYLSLKHHARRST